MGISFKRQLCRTIALQVVTCSATSHAAAQKSVVSANGKKMLKEVARQLKMQMGKCWYFECKVCNYVQPAKAKRRMGILFMISFESLASRNLRPRNNVAVEVVVDVSGVAGVGRLDVSGDLSGGREGRASAAGDLDLRARDVELRGRSGVVNTHLLDTEQVLAGSNARGNGDGVVVCAVVSQCSVQVVDHVMWTYPSGPMWPGHRRR